MYSSRQEPPRINGQYPSLPHTIAARLPIESHTQTQFFVNMSSETLPSPFPYQQPHLPPLQNIPSNNFSHPTSLPVVLNPPSLNNHVTHTSIHQNGLKRPFTDLQNSYTRANSAKKIILDCNVDKKEIEANVVANSKSNATGEKEKFKWPGVQELMESYQRYSKGKKHFKFIFKFRQLRSLILFL